MSAGPTFVAIFYAATTVSLGVAAYTGVPGTGKALGGLVSLSALSLLWANERRAVRMLQLLMKAVRKFTRVEGSGSEGSLHIVSGPLVVPLGDRLALPTWGVEALPSSVALRVQVETFRPLHGWSPQRLLCRKGYWCQASSKVKSAEAVAEEARLGEFRVPAADLTGLEGVWQPFAPEVGERLAAILAGDAGDWSHSLRIKDPFPFPGEIPRHIDGGATLYYQRNGRVEEPAFGDIRVRFLRVPCDAGCVFTAAGVQRGDALVPFQYREAPPSGLELGRALTADFNLGQAYMPVDSSVADEAGMVEQTSQEAIKQSASKVMLTALSASLEGWRRVLHSTAPEKLHGLLPGRHSRVSYILTAYLADAGLTWRIRASGFMLLLAGLEITFRNWQAVLMLFGPAGMALETVVIVAASGFCACTIAAARIFYQPVSATFTLCAGVALFCSVFGVMPLVFALTVVASCMVCVVALFAVNLLLPCC
mmetsp:Transcript_68812/g.192969  ORF Transcript_68812/g.192969 Transcript_68812/m.192969 type:complete len:480 (-) Transcript_68812:311-1750(-)